MCVCETQFIIFTEKLGGLTNLVRFAPPLLLSSSNKVDFTKLLPKTTVPLDIYNEIVFLHFGCLKNTARSDVFNKLDDEKVSYFNYLAFLYIIELFVFIFTVLKIKMVDCFWMGIFLEVNIF